MGLLALVARRGSHDLGHGRVLHAQFADAHDVGVEFRDAVVVAGVHVVGGGAALGELDGLFRVISSMTSNKQCKKYNGRMIIQ